MKIKGLRQAARLKYGQTPWDRLSKRRLLRLIISYHAALSSTASCLRVSRCGNENHPYWAQGVGGRALAEAHWLLDIAKTDIARERLYRKFFRSVNESLFPGAEWGMDRWGWWICETCGEMMANHTNNPQRCCKCEGAWRPFRLSDIRPDLVCPELGDE